MLGKGPDSAPNLGDQRPAARASQQQGAPGSIFSPLTDTCPIQSAPHHYSLICMYTDQSERMTLTNRKTPPGHGGASRDWLASAAPLPVPAHRLWTSHRLWRAAARKSFLGWLVAFAFVPASVAPRAVSPSHTSSGVSVDRFLVFNVAESASDLAVTDGRWTVTLAWGGGFCRCAHGTLHTSNTSGVCIRPKRKPSP